MGYSLGWVTEAKRKYKEMLLLWGDWGVGEPRGRGSSKGFERKSD